MRRESPIKKVVDRTRRGLASAWLSHTGTVFLSDQPVPEESRGDLFGVSASGEERRRLYVHIILRRGVVEDGGEPAINSGIGEAFQLLEIRGGYIDITGESPEVQAVFRSPDSPIGLWVTIVASDDSPGELAFERVHTATEIFRFPARYFRR